MKILIFSFTLTLIVFLFSSCRSESEEKYFSSLVAIHTCDTISVTYNNQIKAIFESKCLECHTAGAVAGCDLDSYEHSTSYIQSTQPISRLYDYVKNNDHQGVILDTCSLKQLAKWMLNPAP